MRTIRSCLIPWIQSIRSNLLSRKSLGLLYYSWKKALLGLVIVFVAAEIMRYNGWWPAPIWVRLLAMVAFGIYAYADTRWTNATIEFYRYGLPGTGIQKPPGA